MRKMVWLFVLISVQALVYGNDIRTEANKAFVERNLITFKEILEKNPESCRLIPAKGKLSTEIFYNDDWHFYDWDQGMVYLHLDNQSIANLDDITLDPFLILRSKVSRNESEVDIVKSWQKFAEYDAVNPGAYAGIPICKISHKLLKNVENKLYNHSDKQIVVKNQTHIFIDSEPFFLLETDAETCEELWWQVSAKPFESDNEPILCSNLEGKLPYSSKVVLDMLTSTFLNPKKAYYFRVCAKHEGAWTNWSDPFSFNVNKPEAVMDAVFDANDDEALFIRWNDRQDQVNYHIFGSNSIDFIPSIYFDKQINGIKEGKICDEEPNNNLLAVTTDNAYKINEQYAYYRIIAERNGNFSVPSPLIRFFKEDLVLPRNVLQQTSNFDASRISYPAPYSQNHNIEDPLEAIGRKLFGGKRAFRPDGVSNEVWDIITPYLMPDNHPVKEKLDRVFGKSRVSHSYDSLVKAGFVEIKMGHWSHATVAKHPNLRGYLVKLFRDEQEDIVDWKQIVRRASGAKSIREAIKRHGYDSIMKVPKKWVYPLPKDPLPNAGGHKKNFILVAEDMKILKSKENRAKWASKDLPREFIFAVYTIITEEGLTDTVQCFNMPFSKDGRIAFIDLEHNHEWPIPYLVLSRYLSSSNKHYWEHLVNTGGKR